MSSGEILERIYKCKKCKNEFKIKYKILSAVKNKVTCLNCFELAEIQLEVPMIQFKGEGFTRKGII
jgi:predicted nucleic acid-binding Zn ribbon protein